MDTQNSIVAAIVSGIVAIAGLIFRAKQKKKVTRRKQKEVTTANNYYSLNKKEV